MKAGTNVMGLETTSAGKSMAESKANLGKTARGQMSMTNKFEQTVDSNAILKNVPDKAAMAKTMKARDTVAGHGISNTLGEKTIGFPAQGERNSQYNSETSDDGSKMSNAAVTSQAGTKKIKETRKTRGGKPKGIGDDTDIKQDFNIDPKLMKAHFDKIAQKETRINKQNLREWL